MEKPAKFQNGKDVTVPDRAAASGQPSPITTFSGKPPSAPRKALNLRNNEGRRGGSALDGRTTRHAGYAVSPRKRKGIEECFGGMKTIGLLRQLRHRGLLKVDWVFIFTAAAYNLVRIRNLQPAAQVGGRSVSGNASRPFRERRKQGFPVSFPKES
jgi:hypothetical protein